MRVMQIHFWGDARDLTGSVEKVLRGFSELNDPEIELDIASIGDGAPEVHARASYFFFQENRWLNRVLNKWLGLKAFTYPSLIKLIEQRRPAILHLHNRQNLADAILAKLSYRPKIVLHYHRHFNPYTVSSCADCLLAVSESVKADVQEKLSPLVPVRVVNNPLPNYLLNQLIQHSFAIGKIRLLYGGGRQAHKGWNEFEAVFTSSQEIAAKYEVRVCGPRLDGYELPFAASNLGMLGQKTFMQELELADVVVMPSHNEGLPLLALEALAMGKVLVSTDAGGLKEIVSSANAFVFPVGDEDALADALTKAADLFAVENKRLLEKHRLQSREGVAKFSAAEVTKRLAAVYKECL